jgi:hypothetical protein
MPSQTDTNLRGCMLLAACIVHSRAWYVPSATNAGGRGARASPCPSFLAYRGQLKRPRVLGACKPDRQATKNTRSLRKCTRPPPGGNVFCVCGQPPVLRHTHAGRLTPRAAMPRMVSTLGGHARMTTPKMIWTNAIRAHCETALDRRREATYFAYADNLLCCGMHTRGG